MTTKEQERKVLAQIKKLVEGLGEDSYVGTAFDGCFQIAEQNIDNDWACSMKQRAEGAEKQLAEYETMAKTYKQLKADFNTMQVEKFEAENRAGFAESKIVELEGEIMKLKSKLYDLMTK